MKTITTHAQKRMYGRKITQDMIDTCLSYGNVIYRTGIRFISLTKKAIKKYTLDPSLEGLNVLISSDGLIITTYKNKSKISEFKKLPKEKNKKRIGLVFA